MIHDQLLEHLQSNDIRQRLLLEPDLTLQKATGLAIQLESATEHAKIMTSDRDAPVRAVQVKSHHAGNTVHVQLLPPLLLPVSHVSDAVETSTYLTQHNILLENFIVNYATRRDILRECAIQLHRVMCVRCKCMTSKYCTW